MKYVPIDTSDLTKEERHQCKVDNQLKFQTEWYNKVVRLVKKDKKIFINVPPKFGYTYYKKLLENLDRK